MTDPTPEALALVDELRRVVLEGPGRAQWFKLNLLEAASRIDRFASKRIESVLLEPSEEGVTAALSAYLEAQTQDSDLIEDMRAALRAYGLTILGRDGSADG